MCKDNEREFDEIFERIEAHRKRGNLVLLIKEGYSVSEEHPDYISKYNSKGELAAIGHCQDGDFVATEVFIEE